MGSLQIVLADDHSVFRMGLTFMLKQHPEWSVVAETGDGLKALSLLQEHNPDMAIVDVRMPGLSGIDVVRRARASGCKTRVLILSECSEDGLVRELVQAYPDGYVLKSEAGAEVERALSALSVGGRYFSPKASARFLEVLRQTSTESSDGRPDLASAKLSEREKEVTKWVSAGLSNKEVAAQLGCSEHTIKAHKANVMRKVGVQNSAGIAAWATRAGLLDT